MHRLAVEVESDIFFLSAAAKNTQLFFVYRRRRESLFLDGFFKIFLFARIFQLEKEKNSGTEHADKKVHRIILGKRATHVKILMQKSYY
jgi:hypothetical protein